MRKVRSVRIRESGNGKSRYPIIKLAGSWIGDLGYCPGGSADVYIGHGRKMIIGPQTEPNDVHENLFVQVYLERFPGLDRRRCTIGTPRDAYEHVRFLEDSDRERFIALYLDAKNQLNGLEEVSKGTLTASLVHPREIYKAAILTNSASIILAHNHPSGNPSPSKEDIELTERISEAGRLLGIDLLDHMIIGNERYASMREEGYL